MRCCVVVGRYVEFEKEMKALSLRHEEEASDWKQFQSDLQTAVVIANAIKAEAVDEKELLMDKNKDIHRRVKHQYHFFIQSTCLNSQTLPRFPVVPFHYQPHLKLIGVWLIMVCHYQRPWHSVSI